MSEAISNSPASSRRLHGVLVADMTNFSRIMGEDESQAVAALARIRDIFSRVVPRHGGTLDVFVGDCFVALFDSAVEAVRAAIAVQTELAGSTGPGGSPVRIRIGIHIGDVMRNGAEILGDSINIAARLQTMARPGGIAVSEDVYRAVRSRLNIPFRDVGTKSLKNIREKIRVFELNVEEGAVGEADSGRSMRSLALVVVGVVGIAVLSLVAYRVARNPPMVSLPAPDVSAALAPVRLDAPLAVGVTGVSVLGEVPGWMQDNTRDGLNTLLSKVGGLRVYSREKIDFLRQKRGLSEIEVAEALGIQKMISGSLSTDGEDVVIEVRIVDTASGVLEASESARGPSDNLIEVQNKIAAEVFAALGLRLSSAEREQLFARRTKDTQEAYRRLADTFGEAPADQPAPAPVPAGTSWLTWTSTAWAQDDSAEVAIRALLESYRLALQREDLEAVAATHLELSAEQRAGFERYFGSADGLTVSLSDIDILLAGDEALATFTRRDVFHDQKSGREMELEVRLSSEVVKKDGHWLLRGVKRSS